MEGANVARPKKDKDMSPETTEVKKNVLIAKKRVFDLEKFEKVTVQKEYEPPAPITDVNEVLNLDATKLLKLVNAGLKRAALMEAKASITGASPKVVNQMVNVFRMLPPYSTMIVKDAEGNATAESRKSQTQAIYAFIKSTPTILDGLKAAAAASAETDEDEDEDGEENEQ